MVQHSLSRPGYPGLHVGSVIGHPKSLAKPELFRSPFMVGQVLRLPGSRHVNQRPELHISTQESLYFPEAPALGGWPRMSTSGLSVIEQLLEAHEVLLARPALAPV